MGVFSSAERCGAIVVLAIMGLVLLWMVGGCEERQKAIVVGAEYVAADSSAKMADPDFGLPQSSGTAGRTESKRQPPDTLRHKRAVKTVRTPLYRNPLDERID